jgi:hypothetical protein
MNKDSIIQFVGFSTELPLEDFITQWENYTKEFRKVAGSMILQQDTARKSRYKFLSQHECREQDFRFAFMKGRNSEHFPDQKVKVVQAGGYSPVQVECKYSEDHTETKITVFLGHDEYDIDFYKKLEEYTYLNIYQAYFESCLYGYILEYFIPETGAAALITQLKARHGIEVATYRECLVPHA